MKNSKLISATLASALLVTAGVGSVSAASASNSVKPVAANTSTVVKTGTATWSVNGTSVTFSTIDNNGTKLYSLRQLVDELGAKLVLGAKGYELNDSKGLHTVVLQAKSTSYQVDGEAQEFTVAPTNANGKLYVELEAVVTALGGEAESEASTILSFGRPEGSFDTLHWSADGSIIANKSDAEATQIIKFSTIQGNYDTFSSNDSAVDFAVSPDHTWGAFNDNVGQLNLINLSSGAIKPLGKDTTVKVDLTWSQDGKTIYFITGDKQESIAKISVETGEVKSILADKVENKSELRISADEKSAVYILNVTGVAKNDADSTEDSLSVDFTNAGEQLYKLDLALVGAKPVALTTTPDNKLYPQIQADGTVVYLSADSDGKSANILKVVKADGTSSAIALDVEPTWLTTVSTGLIVSGVTTSGSTVVYSIDASGAKKELYRTSEDVSEVSLSADGSKLAIVSEDKVVVIQDGKAVELSK